MFEDMQGWAALAIPNSWEYAYLRREALLGRASHGCAFSPCPKALWPLAASPEDAKGHVHAECLPAAALAPALPCVPALVQQCCETIPSSCTLIAGVHSLPVSRIRRGDKAFVIICFASIDLSPSAVTSPQNIWLCVSRLVCSGSIQALTEGSSL